jgi:O-acetyl-ADP-ribose deacetylase (regulator of RNase III)
MIHYKTGNLLDSEAEALVNTVNTVGVMGKGIALQFKNMFPNNFKLYAQACKNKEVKVGQLLVTEEEALLTGKKIIINFPTKTN